MENDDAELLLTPAPISNKHLVAATAKARQARDLELEVLSLEERLKETRKQLRDIYTIELPNLMDEAQTDHIGIPAQGNLPAVDLKLTPYYRANIAAGWDDERKDAAFSALTDIGADSLIRTEITINFGRGQRQSAIDLAQKLIDEGLDPIIKQSVNWKTLSAWLKEQYQRGNPVPPLDIIGADVGRVVEMIERKS